jgi:hypothetical protein
MALRVADVVSSAARRQHRVARLPEMQTLGDAVNE